MTVLLVEDDTIVRLTMCEFLEEAGLQIVEAGDAEEALALLEEPAHSITVLVTDLDLGLGDNGLMLAAKARQWLPDLQVVYATGSPEKLAGHQVAAWERVFLKPFDLTMLTAAVRVLEQSPRSATQATDRAVAARRHRIARSQQADASPL
ncbi:response regulator [Siccirubricoccus sp. G192]|uniref:response regulator n=1 Tax=Siccirubricoccus sp. G192 TaxID=2849651 RepID=UPI001C2BD57C|nr:response regulator [Siccirubricoccus sp. G192]MBV1800442.1 response regulator [Siccirubricoccus sp. G192]